MHLGCGEVAATFGPPPNGLEGCHVELSYVSEGKGKVGLRPSRSAIKRVGLALALTLGVAGAADVGYDYVTTGRYLETTDDAYVKADSTIIAPKVSGYVAEVASLRQRAGEGRSIAGTHRRP